ncbi:malic enzyme-like NAD(P)-binding protein [Methanosarcina barkeri]|uniref:malic enzyme-like NAD(P)-binding protein n=1 Tax=Methanosarcina barkeri TaxID=2208 RepID=UPI0009B68CE6
MYVAGVQFPPVHYNGDIFLPGQANKFYIYPAVGLTVYVTRAKRITNEIFTEAAKVTARPGDR